MRVSRGEMFRRVQVLRPGRSVFDLSYAKKFSGMMGYLYPVMCDEVVPGDVFKIGADAVIRFAPMVAPILHEIMVKADFFFVPYRLIAGGTVNNNWEKFITGGQDGNDVTTRVTLGLLNMHDQTVQEGGLWDHLGIPPGVTLPAQDSDDSPSIYPAWAYNCIWNEYYRDPSYDSLHTLTTTSVYSRADAVLQYANWDADYFTRATGDTQRGTQPALPITGSTTAVFDGDVGIDWPAISAANAQSMTMDNTALVPFDASTKSTLEKGIAPKVGLDLNTVDLSSATSVTISDLRLAVQLQKWMERNMRAGYRYTEFLQAHFGVAPRDDRMNRPEYIGGIRQPVMISEVLQTSATAAVGATETEITPQGNLAGHGIAAGNFYIGKYHVKEYGIIMGILSVTPRPGYSQGINRQWLRQTRYDYYHPEFANLSEQAIMNEEIYLDTVEADNIDVFGYQGRYDEMRVKHDMVAGAFRSTLDYWHLAREFAACPSPGTTFGKVDPTTVARCFADTSGDNIYVHWGNSITAIRPLPSQSNPGLLDHSYGGI